MSNQDEPTYEDLVKITECAAELSTIAAAHHLNMYAVSWAIRKGLTFSELRNTSSAPNLVTVRIHPSRIQSEVSS